MVSNNLLFVLPTPMAVSQSHGFAQMGLTSFLGLSCDPSRLW